MKNTDINYKYKVTLSLLRQYLQLLDGQTWELQRRETLVHNSFFLLFFLFTLSHQHRSCLLQQFGLDDNKVLVSDEYQNSFQLPHTSAKVHQSPEIQSSCTKLYSLIDISSLNMPECSLGKHWKFAIIRPRIQIHKNVNSSSLIHQVSS